MNRYKKDEKVTLWKNNFNFSFWIKMPCHYYFSCYVN